MTYIPTTTPAGEYWPATLPIGNGDGWASGTSTIGGSTITWTPQPERITVKVALSLAEVDVLRRAATDNPALRAVLNRLADCIDVDVDFDDDADEGVKTGV